LTPAVFVLLLALSDGERHGYGLAQDVAELTGGAIRMGPGTLYRSLQRMQVDGLVQPVHDAPIDDMAAGRGQRRRSYRITEAGREAARTEARWLSLLVKAAGQRGLLDDHTATTSADMETTVTKGEGIRLARTPPVREEQGRGDQLLQEGV
jgi:DNA-binding PadR family transcriptional regulator